MCYTFFIITSDFSDFGGGSGGSAFLRVELATGRAESVPNTTKGCTTSMVASNGLAYYIAASKAAKLVYHDGNALRRSDGEFPNVSPGLTPAIVDGRMYFREHTHLVCYDLRREP